MAELTYSQIKDALVAHGFTIGKRLVKWTPFAAGSQIYFVHNEQGADENAPLDTRRFTSVQVMCDPRWPGLSLMRARFNNSKERIAHNLKSYPTKPNEHGKMVHYGVLFKLSPSLFVPFLELLQGELTARSSASSTLAKKVDAKSDGLDRSETSEFEATAHDLDELALRTDLTPTEKKVLQNARVGQGPFRQELLRQWNKCPVTGVTEPLLLRASHIKPWRLSTDAERLDPSNGLLLAVHVDAAFDRGLLTFEDDGKLLLSPQLSRADAEALGLERGKSIPLSARRREYLVHHRNETFKR